MTVSLQPRTGTPQWSVGSDPVTRAQFNAAFAALEAGTVYATVGTLAARPAAGAANAKTFYQDENGVIYWSNGTTWAAVGSGSERQYTNAAAAGTVTLDLNAYDTFRLTATDNVVIALANPPAAGTAKRFVLRVIQDGTGGRTLTLPASMQPDGGTAPTLNTAANQSASIEARTTDAGTSYQYRAIWQSAPPVAVSQTFSYTGAAQTVVVPAGRTSVAFDVRGAAGVSGGTNGGLGGRVQGALPVTAGETLQINIAGAGAVGANSGATAAGGFGGGGSGVCSGGGASDIRRSPNGLADRVIVAGGGGGSGPGVTGNGSGGGGGYFGGGGGGWNTASGTAATAGASGVGGNGGSATGVTGALTGTGDGGGAGGLTAAAAGANGGGGGGTASAGGAAGPSGNGTGRQAGGGGSSFAGATATGVSHTAGVQSGNGVAVLTWS